MPMILRGSPMSPFARKVRMAILHLRLVEKIEFVRADPMNPEDVLRQNNPLGKIPVLVTEDGKAVYDSRVILEFLDHAAGGGIIIPDDWPARLGVLTMQAMCDGIMDACILIIYEARHRPTEIHHQPWLDYQRGKVVRALTAFAKAPPDPTHFNVGTIAAACMLGYLDFRRQVDWRKDFSGLVPWLDAFRAKHPEFDATVPPETP
ncbi:MAG TPA: glutathione S-transferase N-terminal domain-containing protein [Xanthobacteraceae bacterium]|nr:glutathione S-transferase N-terminal domain-containing protein [Xanthobacteraceae bacterium]